MCRANTNAYTGSESNSDTAAASQSAAKIVGLQGTKVLMIGDGPEGSYDHC